MGFLLSELPDMLSMTVGITKPAFDRKGRIEVRKERRDRIDRTGYLADAVTI
jgi:hypothetical protein